jgi:hypothetical protein
MKKVDSSILKPAMSVDMVDGMSVELPSALLQLNSGLLFGSGERSGMLPPLPSSLFGARTSGQGTPGGQAGDAADLQMPKAMSLELLPSSWLHSYSGLLQDLKDAVGERDADQQTGAPAGAGAAAAGGVFGGKQGSGGFGLGGNGQAAQPAAAAAAAGVGGGLNMQLSGVLDTSMDVGQALDELMAGADLQ